jgi:amino acid transporter/nucleotide-binding universal stress UspA family protein
VTECQDNTPQFCEHAVVSDNERHIGLGSATGIGVGAIVGGGILALAGVAFATTGPAALLAFALNGVIALLTALSLGEMASKFPESGGTYAFSRKVLSIEAAFAVGWIVWFASIVAAMLYAVGFGYFSVLLLRECIDTLGYALPRSVMDQRLVPWIAILAVLTLAVGLVLKSGGGGSWANAGKVLVFGILILGGLWSVARQPLSTTQASLQPFFSSGAVGLFEAMGFSFIALQGFDLIAAVGGEIRNPARNIPRAMVFSLVIALLIYLPLLFVITTVGVSDGQGIADAAAENPEGIVAIAARNYLGPVGYGFVLVAAVLSMFTALQANLFAASRIALAMSRDHTLPSVMSRLSPRRHTPIHAITVTAGLISILVIALPDVAAAGAAASLIFLITFAMAHWLAVLVRRRSVSQPPFQSPLYPAVPLIGGTACVALAVFQGLVVPSAGTIAVVWLSIGGILFLTLFARRARLKDVSSMAANPELLRLRGNSPLVLVPIANPRNAEAMISLANTLVPAAAGRVLLQTVVVAPSSWDPDADPAPADQSQAVLRELIRASSKLKVPVETLTTVSPDPMPEIARVAKLHRCESVLLGLSKIDSDQADSPLETLLGKLESDVVVLRASGSWSLSETQRILVLVAGRGGHDHLLARLLASFSRQQKCIVTFMRVLPAAVDATEFRRAKRDLNRMAHDNVFGTSEQIVIKSDDPVEVISAAAEGQLVILGVQRIGPRRKLFGQFTRKIANQTDSPLIVISRRG